eukprot:TRINITY_DN1285_c0_g1_i5.p3 TRINITY_DN1285_c0_g1~~TRINITY_DN1285_c0_g1_i5.p3  ORF type:complete len:168 (-),score=50.78 TRINITY_DN1285_c0_g1_i5:612-1115(-)
MRASMKYVLFVLTVVAVFVTAQDGDCECDDVPPPHAPVQFSCEQQDAWEKCNEEWMIGYCKCTCDTCQEAASPEEEYVEEYGDMFGRAAVAESEVIPEEPVGPGACGDFDEPRSCTFSRNRCCSKCASEAEVDFECIQNGNSYASSCSCSGAGGSATARAVSSSTSS